VNELALIVHREKGIVIYYSTDDDMISFVTDALKDVTEKKEETWCG